MSETGERGLQLGPHRTWRCAKRLVGTAVRCASGHNTRETLRRLVFSLSATSPPTTHMMTSSSVSSRRMCELDMSMSPRDAPATRGIHSWARTCAFRSSQFEHLLSIRASQPRASDAARAADGATVRYGANPGAQMILYERAVPIAPVAGDAGSMD